jgi:hypothetical protein
MSFVGESAIEKDDRRLSADQVQATMQQIHEHLRIDMRHSQVIQEGAINRARTPAWSIQEGTQVWLDARHIPTTRPPLKLDWKRLGPFRVVRRMSPYASELVLHASIRIHRVQPVPLLSQLVEYPMVGQRVEPPPPVEVDGEAEYKVSSVEDSRMYRSQLQYLIWWTG